MINKALSVSGKSKLSYIGHNEGTTSFYVLASELPDMSSKIERHISLGPVVFLKNSANDVLHNIEAHIQQRSVSSSSVLYISRRHYFLHVLI